MQPVITTEDIAELIRSRRRELKINQAELAARIGVSRQWIIDIEKGKPRAELALILATLAALDLQLQCKVQKRAVSTVDVKQGEEKIRALADAFDFLI